MNFSKVSNQTPWQGLEPMALVASNLGLRDFGFTVQFHAQRPRLPHIMFEIRQNEIATPEQAVRYAEIVHESVQEALADLELYLRQHHGERDDASLGQTVLRDAVRDGLPTW